MSATACGSDAKDEIEGGAMGDGDAGTDGDPGGDASVDGDPGDGDGDPVDGNGDGDGGDGGDGDPVEGEAPTLTTVEFRQVGRFGDDVRIDVTGSDPDGDATSIEVTFYGENDEPYLLFDTDGDGAPDTGTTFIALNATIGAQSGSTAFVLFSAYHTNHAGLDHVTVSLVDEEGSHSEEKSADIDEQEEVAIGGQCDPDFLKNRCAVGLGCKGTTPKVCAAGEKPVIARAGYFVDDLGLRVLIEGTDPDGDASAYTVSFLDASNNPVSLDLDGDGSPDSTEFKQEVGVGVGGGTAYFFSFVPSDQFAEVVAKVSLTVHDRGNLNSDAKVVSKTAAPLRSTNVTCDPRGFDRCANGSVCNPGVVGATNRCQTLTTARNAACTMQQQLTVNSEGVSVRGSLGNVSLWDAPEGCSSNDPVRRPDGLVRIVLAEDAATLVLSTDNGYTDFDTTLYLLAACDETPVGIWCADDQEGGMSPQKAVLTLTDVPAGDYFVVVDSFPSQVGGSRYQLDARVE